MLRILLALSIAHATSLQRVVRSRLALLQLSHRLGHHAPIAPGDPDRALVYAVLFENDYRGEVFRTVECCGDIRAALRGTNGPLLDAFVKDGFGDYPGAIRTKLRAELIALASMRGTSPEDLVNALERALVKPSPATLAVFTPAFRRTQEDVVELLGRTAHPAATRPIAIYLRGLKDTFGPAVERSPGFANAVEALRRVRPRQAHDLVRKATGVLVPRTTLIPPPASCIFPLVSVESPRRPWWARLFRRGGPL